MRDPARLDLGIERGFALGRSGLALLYLRPQLFGIAELDPRPRECLIELPFVRLNRDQPILELGAAERNLAFHAAESFARQVVAQVDGLLALLGDLQLDAT